MTKKQVEGQLSLFDLDLCCGKMFPAHSPATTEKTFVPFSKKLQKSQNRPPLFLDLRENGQTQAAFWETDGQSLGAYLTRSFGESPSVVVVSRLSQILEANAHPKYCLSAKACQGILKRAEKRRKTLPEMLKQALLKQVEKTPCLSTGNSHNGQAVIGVLQAIKRKNFSCKSEIKNLTLGESQTNCIYDPSDCQAVVCVAHSMPHAEICKDLSPTLTCHHEQPFIHFAAVVRRLTPLECERLQGYPDSWTDIGDWTDRKGKVHKTSDSARYKALGNSIALPPWRWVLRRLSAYCGKNPTMASLFDGIGGFPLLWEQINGKGSCLWASEVEEFSIAVTQKRFQTIQRR